MEKGRVYWITGLPDSGKTTVGTALYYDLKKKGHNVVILDGDIMKEITSGSIYAQFERNDRLIRAKRYSQLSKLLSDQGVWVIVCVIAMYDEIRDWNRENINDYIEVFLNPSDEILKNRNTKGLYRKLNNVQLPKKPDLILANDGQESMKNMLTQIEHLIPRKSDDYDRDRGYWNSYYKKIRNEMLDPSGFAIKINSKLKKNSNILELGCGNGRDSLYFLNQGHKVTAIDGSDTAIDILNDMTENNENAMFVCDDFVKCHTIYQIQYDCIYSRFTLHAINEEQENELLRNVRDALSHGGIFCIEARTIHDEIFGKGEDVGNNAYIYNGHYRRFTDVDLFRNKLTNIGFKVDYLEERAGFSKTKDSDPVLMRCIASILK